MAPLPSAGPQNLLFAGGEAGPTAIAGVSTNSARGPGTTGNDRHYSATSQVIVPAFAAHAQARVITAALDVGVPPRHVQDAGSHADPRTTMPVRPGTVSLDRHATYIVAAFIAGAAR